MGTAAATQPTETHNNPLINLLDNNQPRTSTLMHTLQNGTSPATPADLIEGITQIMNRVTNNNKRDDASKKMMKNIKIFDSSNKAECITWLSQIEAEAKLTNTPFRELICQSMVPAMLHVFSDLSALASDADIKEAILTNYSDIPSSTETATRLQNIQFSMNEPLVTFNHRYEAIHKVAFKMSPNEQESKTLIVEYTKKLPANTRDKLLRKIAKKNSYVKMLDNAFKQALDINWETSFVEAATGRYNDQNGTIHLKTLDQITEATVTRATMTATTGRTTAETMAETEITNSNQDTNREIKTTQTGLTIIKIEIGTTITKTDTGLTTEGDQTNTNTTETNTKLKSSLNSQTKT